MRPLPVRQRDLDDLDPIAENGTQLSNAVSVGAIAPANHESTAVEPDRIAAFEASRRLDATADRHRHMAGRCGAFLRGGLLDALRFAHPAEDQAAVAHNRRVADIDRIER